MGGAQALRLLKETIKFSSRIVTKTKNAFLKNIVATVRHLEIQKIQITHTFTAQYSSRGEKNHDHDLITVWGFIDDLTQTKMCKVQVREKGTKVNWKPENVDKNLKKASSQWENEIKSLRSKEH